MGGVAAIFHANWIGGSIPQFPRGSAFPDGVAHDLLAAGALSERYTSALNLWICWLCGDYGSSPQGGSE